MQSCGTCAACACTPAVFYLTCEQNKQAVRKYESVSLEDVPLYLSLNGVRIIEYVTKIGVLYVSR